MGKSRATHSREHSTTRGMTEQVKQYSTPGQKSVRADCIEDAATVFADRRARMEFGQRGYCSKCIHRASALDGSFAEFFAIIRRSGGELKPISRSVRLIVYRTEALDGFLDSLVIDDKGNLRLSN